MHFEILIEDASGKKMIENLTHSIIGNNHTYKVISYKGIGNIPSNMKDPKDVRNRLLLDNLPRLLKGYGKTFFPYGANYPAVVIIICDLDDRCLHSFRQQLVEIQLQCNPCPSTKFCFAIEEGEAWLLGDINAIIHAYPKAKKDILYSYQNDSICGTWEVLADAVYSGGSQSLKKQGWQAIGKEKNCWAERITCHMNVECNRSPSFNHFLNVMRQLLESE